MIELKVTGDTQIIENFEGLPAAMRQALLLKVQAATFRVVDRAKQKVSGEVLQVRTGNLRANIFGTVRDEGDQIVGQVAVSNSVPYARIHEYGGTIKHPGSDKFQAFYGKAGMVFTHYTKPHNIPMPERSYLRSSLAELAPSILEDLSSGIRDAIAKK